MSTKISSAILKSKIKLFSQAMHSWVKRRGSNVNEDFTVFCQHGKYSGHARKKLPRSWVPAQDSSELHSFYEATCTLA